LPKKATLPMEGFSYATIPGTGSAAGFVFNGDDVISNCLDWSIELNFVNGSEKNVIVNKVSCDFFGEKSYLSRSVKYVTVKENNNEIFFPILLKSGSKNVYKFDFLLEVYKKKFFVFHKAYFNKSDISPPETYQEIIKNIEVSVWLHGKKNPIKLTI